MPPGSQEWNVPEATGMACPTLVADGHRAYAIFANEDLAALDFEGTQVWAKNLGLPDNPYGHTASLALWQNRLIVQMDQGVPDICSPVSNGELLFALTTSGTLTCFDAKNGKKQWDHDFEMEFRASPSIAGNRLYLLESTGKVIVLEVNRQFKELARSDLGEPVYASPAFVKDRTYIRSTKTLFCIGGK